MIPEIIHTHDMYGNEIIRLGETGYGVSTTFSCYPSREPPYLWPKWTLFHISDGFRQSLFSVSLDEIDKPTLVNIFHDRVLELMSTYPHGFCR